MSDYLAINKAYWDDRAPAHAADGYGVQRYIDDPGFLSEVVRFDLPRLGRVAGLDALHLQCHIGTDTLSLHRLGARMTGLDLSTVSLAEARRLAERAGASIDYVEADTYSAVDVLGARRFDLVYSSIGTLLWLPDIDRWAATVAGLLKPGGRLFIRDSHPMISALDVVDDHAEPVYPYFAQPEPTVFDGDDTYVDTAVELKSLPTWEFAHSIGEILTAVLDAGLTITGFDEHPSVPYRALGVLMEEDPEHAGEFRFAGHPERIAASFTLQARS
ncbi:class I SAM-dependent methyltransferase [Schumannella luteola]